MKVLLLINCVWLFTLTLIVLDLKSSWKVMGRSVSGMQDVLIDYLKSEIGKKRKQQLALEFERR